jgi:glycosyltransferase involved in cell wall biosynthesis
MWFAPEQELSSMRFSVVLTTRNRPDLLRRALASVLCQSCSSFEVIVVEDGSLPEFASEYDAISRQVGAGPRFYRLPLSQAGSGPSRPRNYAVEHCRGEFIAFLDDDDEWTDSEYLATAEQTLAANPECDLHLMNQRAVSAEGTLITRSIWIEDLAGKLERSRTGACVVSPSDLLRSNGFCHLNTTILRRSLLQATLGGFDESFLYEEDRDLYLRAIEAARCIIYNPRIVARHHVPDPKYRGSASNRLTVDERAAFRLRVLEKAMSRTRHNGIYDHCRKLKGHTLKRIAASEAALGNFGASYRYAQDGLAAEFSYKWLGFVGWLWLRRTIACLAELALANKVSGLSGR